MSAQKNRAVFGVLLMVFLFFIILMVFAAYTMNIFKSEMSSLDLGKGKASIAVVEVEGVIMSSKKIIKLLQMAEKDRDTKAIILRVNSPGGAVGPTQEIYEEIRRIDQAYDDTKKLEESERKGKPIYSSFGAIAASGGYYVGAATRRIYSNPGTLTGSIGVIMNFYDLSKLSEIVKVKSRNIKSGRYKDIGDPFRNMTGEENDLLTNMIKGVHNQFINDILKLRKKKIKGDIRELAQGQIFSGEEAQQHGLVDRLKGLWEAGREIHKELGFEGEMKFKYIKKKKNKGLMQYLDRLDEAISNFDMNAISGPVPMLMFKL